jgi:hypothetical protein
VTARSPRPDVVDVLRPARDELERIVACAHLSYDQARAAMDGPVHDQHTYLTAQLEAAHAHMVGEHVAEAALHSTLGRPLGREPWRRDGAEYQFGQTLRDFAYHRERFRSNVRGVEDWIRQFGRPAPPQREAEAER